MDYPESFDHMMAAWNEREPERVRGHLEKALHPEVHFVDPSANTRGIDEFEANVHEVHARIPGAEYKRSSGVDGHNDLYRYHWEIRRNGELVMPGFDVTEVDAEGRVTRVVGFFGPIPTE